MPLLLLARARVSPAMKPCVMLTVAPESCVLSRSLRMIPSCTTVAASFST
jgi:hypothetical protein